MEFFSGNDMNAEMVIQTIRSLGGFKSTFYISNLHIQGTVCLYFHSEYVKLNVDSLNSSLLERHNDLLQHLLICHPAISVFSLTH